MRRHDSLIPLTHDHHHALKRARRMRLASEAEEEERLAAAADFLEFYGSEILTHFHEEEEEVFPLLLARPDAPTELLTRILLEHVRMHGLVRVLRQQVEADDVQAGTLAETAELLRAHIRLEEDELFPLIERLVPDEDLHRVHLAPRERSTT